MMALAPISAPFWTIRSIAWRRVSSSRLVYSWISPPPMRPQARHEVAPEAAAADDDAEHWPFVSATRYPAMNGAVG